MLKQRKIVKHTEIFIITIIWVAVLAAPIFIFGSDEINRWNRIYRAWLSIVPYFVLFCLNHFLLLPILSAKRKKYVYYLSALALVLVFNVALFLNHRLSQRKIHHHEVRGGEHPFMQRPGNRPRPPRPHDRQSDYPPILGNFILSVLIIGFDSGLRMMTKLAEVEQDKNLIEKENVENQLAFLKNQISPHFFMNTLNNIHSLMDFNVEEAKESVIKLSKLMRHLLYESEATLTPLKKEIEFVKSYVNLMKLRFTENVEINLDIPDLIPDKSIPPLLFTSLIENAFKYGVSYAHKSFINIVFKFAEDELALEIENSKNEVKSDEKASGIGIVNARKRLKLLYGENYTFEIKESVDNFKVKLKIPL